MVWILQPDSSATSVRWYRPTSFNAVMLLEIVSFLKKIKYTKIISKFYNNFRFRYKWPVKCSKISYRISWQFMIWMSVTDWQLHNIFSIMVDVRKGLFWIHRRFNTGHLIITKNTKHTELVFRTSLRNNWCQISNDQYIFSTVFCPSSISFQLTLCQHCTEQRRFPYIVQKLLAVSVIDLQGENFRNRILSNQAPLVSVSQQ